MKNFRFSYVLLFLLAGLSFTACNDDDFFDDIEEPPPPPPGPTVTELALDGPNATGPILAEGLHRLGVQFYETDLTPLVGRNLTQISVFVGQVPGSMRLSVHSGGDVVPGIEISGVDVDLSSFSGPDFYDFPLTDPVVLDDSDVLWLVAEVVLDNDQQSIGCDAGPAQEGGDWLWSRDRWLTYRTRTNESVNWNIRGLVE